MYIPYMLMLRKESFFHFNRILLVSIMLLSLILPLCDFHALSVENNPIQHGIATISMPAVMNESTPNVTEAKGFNWAIGVYYIYLIGLIATTLWKAIQIFQLYRTIHKGVLWKDKQNGITIYCHAHDIAPLSWFNSIAISEEDYLHNSDEILKHEIGHITHHHSSDVLLANIIEIIQWWNPFSWLIASSLRDVHEYEADNEVRTSGINIRKYQILLIRKTAGSSSYTFANGFNHSLLKKRITMMLRSKSNPWMRTKALYIIPVATIAVSVFATPELNNRVDALAEKVETSITNKDTNIFSTAEVAEQENIPANEINEKITKNSLTTKVEEYKRAAWDTCTWNENDTATWNDLVPQADVMPKFPGGNEAMSKHIRQSKFGQFWTDRGPSLFIDIIIEKDGSIVVKDCHFTSKYKVDPKDEQEIIVAAKEMCATMPKWIPAQKNGENIRYGNYALGFAVNVKYEEIEQPLISWDD